MTIPVLNYCGATEICTCDKLVILYTTFVNYMKFTRTFIIMLMIICLLFQLRWLLVGNIFRLISFLLLVSELGHWNKFLCCLWKYNSPIFFIPYSELPWKHPFLVSARIHLQSIMNFLVVFTSIKYSLFLFTSYFCLLCLFLLLLFAVKKKSNATFLSLFICKHNLLYCQIKVSAALNGDWTLITNGAWTL